MAKTGRVGHNSGMRDNDIFALARFQAAAIAVVAAGVFAVPDNIALAQQSTLSAAQQKCVDRGWRLGIVSRPRTVETGSQPDQPDAACNFYNHSGSVPVAEQSYFHDLRGWVFDREHYPAEGGGFSGTDRRVLEFQSCILPNAERGPTTGPDSNGRKGEVTCATAFGDDFDFPPRNDQWGQRFVVNCPANASPAEDRQSCVCDDGFTLDPNAGEDTVTGSASNPEDSGRKTGICKPDAAENESDAAECAELFRAHDAQNKTCGGCLSTRESGALVFSSRNGECERNADCETLNRRPGPKQDRARCTQQCEAGYFPPDGNDVTEACLDVDECAGTGTETGHPTHTCGPAETSTCANTDGDYECGCADGYEKTPGAPLKLPNCRDIDECARNRHNCSAQQTCTNREAKDGQKFVCCPAGAVATNNAGLNTGTCVPGGTDAAVINTANACEAQQWPLAADAAGCQIPVSENGETPYDHCAFDSSAPNSCDKVFADSSDPDDAPNFPHRPPTEDDNPRVFVYNCAGDNADPAGANNPVNPKTECGCATTFEKDGDGNCVAGKDFAALCVAGGWTYTARVGCRFGGLLSNETGVVVVDHKGGAGASVRYETRNAAICADPDFGAIHTTPGTCRDLFNDFPSFPTINMNSQGQEIHVRCAPGTVAGPDNNFSECETPAAAGELKMIVPSGLLFRANPESGCRVREWLEACADPEASADSVPGKLDEARSCDPPGNGMVTVGVVFACDGK